MTQGEDRTLNIYIIPEAEEFGPSTITNRDFDVLRFSDEIAKDNLPLKLSLSRLPDGFWFRIPKLIGNEGTLVEIETIPMEPKSIDDFRSLEESIKWSQRPKELTVPGAKVHYLIDNETRSNEPWNLYLLYIPKGSNLQKLQQLYPQGRWFDFDEQEARQALAVTAIPGDEVPGYIDLLHRGGALFLQKRDGERAILEVQPGARLVVRKVKAE